MVLAAGAGTRLRPLTFETPKPMVPVVNRPVLHHVLDNLSRHGVREVALNLHAQPEQVRGYCGNGARWALDIRYSHEPRLLGTAGSLKPLESFFRDQTFLVMSGDGLSDADLAALARFHRQKRSCATMVVKAVESRFEYGVTLMDPAGRIHGFLEKPSWGEVFPRRKKNNKPLPIKVNTGIYMFEPEVLRLIPKGRPCDFGHDVWPKLLRLRKRIFAWEWKGYWCDVGNLAEYRKAQVDSLDGRVGIRIPGRQIRKGVWAEEDARIDPKATLHPPCLIGRGVAVEAGAQIGPYTVVGDRSRVASNAVLKNCTLFDGVSVSRDVHLSNCVIGSKGSVRSDISAYEAAVLNIRQ